MLSLSLCLFHVCYHIIVRNSLCTSVTPITASSNGGTVMPVEALNAFLQNVMITWSAYPLHVWEVLCQETSIMSDILLFHRPSMQSQWDLNKAMTTFFLIFYDLLFTGHSIL